MKFPTVDLCQTVQIYLRDLTSKHLKEWGRLQSNAVDNLTAAF